MKLCKRGLHQYEGSRCRECKKLCDARFNTTHPTYKDEYNRVYYSKNREGLKIKTKLYAKANPGKVNALTLKRKADRIQRRPKWLSMSQLQEIEQFYIDAKELQWLSDPSDPLEVDHIVPLRGKNVSGLHVPWNLQILTKSQNIRKGNRVTGV